MEEFSNSCSSTLFISAATQIENGRGNEKGFIYVEDRSDIYFWEKLFSIINTEKYDFMVYSNKPKNTINGKRILEQKFDEVNRLFMIAIDSDFDYLCPNQRKGHYFTNKYILHTFGYSKESVLIEKNRLKKFFQNTKHTINNKIDIVRFIDEFSALCFFGLSRYVNEINNMRTISEKDFHSCFNILGENLIYEDELSFNFSTLNKIKRNFELLFENYQENHEHEETLNKLYNLKITEENAYRFISGHVLHDTIAKIHETLKKYLLKKELELEKSECENPQELVNRKKYLHKIFESNFSIETFFRNNFYDETDDLIYLIQQKIKNLE